MLVKPKHLARAVPRLPVSTRIPRLYPSATPPRPLSRRKSILLLPSLPRPRGAPRCRVRLSWRYISRSGLLCNLTQAQESPVVAPPSNLISAQDRRAVTPPPQHTERKNSALLVAAATFAALVLLGQCRGDLPAEILVPGEVF